MRSLLLALVCLQASLPACLEDFPDPDTTPAAPLTIGEARTIDLRYLRFDVQSFAKRYTKAELRALPADIKDRLWLLDLDITGGPNRPHLLDHSLDVMKALDPATLPPAARNMQRLLTMSPATAAFAGTSLDELLSLGPLLGLAPGRVLADMLQANSDDPFLSNTSVAQVILQDVILTHPNARTRLGPRTADNPDGIYPVTPGTLPVMLADAAADFETLATRFGPYDHNGEHHPGFMVGTVHSEVLPDDFAMTVRANANALPFKGVDLTNVSATSVNSIPSQIDSMFDFDDPSWVTFEGLEPGSPTIAQMTFRIVEHNGFVRGGDSQIPLGRGNSAVWQLPPWTFERIVADAARIQLGSLQSTTKYYLPERTDPVFTATVDDGWTAIHVTADLGNPPPPAYLWDTLLEVAEVRLHDDGVAEGEAVIDLPLTDVPVGIDARTISATIKQNLEADPRMLKDIAATIADNTSGDSDFYYVRRDDTDYLFFVAADDIPRQDDGITVRDYSYAHVGFYADQALTTKLSTQRLVDGDTTHEKVAITSGDVLFAEDDQGQVFEVHVNDKPSTAHVSLTVTRVR